MATHEFWQLSAVSDEHLLENLSGLLAAGARSEAHIVAHLAEVEERRLHLKAATSSLFDYCQRRIGLSESEAFHRITAARLARKFPVIFGLLAARAIHLSALRALRDHLTSDNHRELLTAASGRSKKEVEVLVAGLAPRPDVAERLRKVPAARGRARPSPAVTATPVAALVAPVCSAVSTTAPAALVAPVCSAASTIAPASVPVTSTAAPVAPFVATPKGPRALEPLSSTRYLLRLSISHEMKGKLERARDLMSHANPGGELRLVFEKALELLLEKLEKQRFSSLEDREARGQTKRARRAAKVPRERPLPQVEGMADAESIDCTAGIGDVAPARRGVRREHVPNEIRRAVAVRDDYRCTYVDDEGRRCGCQAFLQLHHERAHALGGPSTFENLRLLCAAHNRLLAERDFGRVHQERFTANTAWRSVFR